MSTLTAAAVLFALWLAWGWVSWQRTLNLARRFDALSVLPRFLLSACALVLSGAALIGGWLAVSAIGGDREWLDAAGFAVFLIAGSLFVSLQMFGACLIWRAGMQVTSGAGPASNPRSDHNRQQGEQE
ncbi:MAG: hypothetical protein C4340_04145 [Armatimonadota bacterium]